MSAAAILIVVKLWPQLVYVKASAILVSAIPRKTIHAIVRHPAMPRQNAGSTPDTRRNITHSASVAKVVGGHRHRLLPQTTLSKQVNCRPRSDRAGTPAV
jgi:hypothetical protein